MWGFAGIRYLRRHWPPEARRLARALLHGTTRCKVHIAWRAWEVVTLCCITVWLEWLDLQVFLYSNHDTIQCHLGSPIPPAGNPAMAKKNKKWQPLATSHRQVVKR